MFKKIASSCLEGPGIPIPPEATAVNGITDADVAGKRLDDDLVRRTLKDVKPIVAHNASFDRPLFERGFPDLADFHWACSMKDIDWTQEGLQTAGLELLSYRFDSHYDLHRVLPDYHAAIYVLSQKLRISGRPAMARGFCHFVVAEMASENGLALIPNQWWALIFFQKSRQTLSAKLR